VQDLLTALSLVLVIEGIAYALAPDGMKRMAAAVAQTPPRPLRLAGLAAAVVGVSLVWLIRG